MIRGDDIYMVYYSESEHNNESVLELLMELLIDVYLTNDKREKGASETSDDNE